MLWSEESDRLLIQFWDEGGSLAFVADKMQQAGYHVTRNAIAGRRHRLANDNSFKRPPNTQATQPVKAKTKRRPPQRIRIVKTMDQLLEEMSKNEGVEYLRNPENGCKAILDRPRSGKWKLQMVCGKPRVGDGEFRSPYCRCHLHFYTNPQPQRKVHG